MDRRKFLLAGSAGVAGGWVGSKILSAGMLSSWGVGRTFAAPAPLRQKVAAFDTVELGKNGIRTSHLTMGTGSIGSGHRSNQNALGLWRLSRARVTRYDHGLRQ